MSVAADASKQMFGCPECARRFTRYENLRRHIGTSHKEEFHQCKYCVKKLKRPDLLKRHVKILHKDKFDLEYSKPTVRSRRGSPSGSPGSVKVTSRKTPAVTAPPVNQQSPANSSTSDGSVGTGSGVMVPVTASVASPLVPTRTTPLPAKLHLPAFQAPDIPKTYDPKLHQYYSDLPFLPPKFLTHYKDIFCDRILSIFPVFDKKVFDEEKVAASFLRAIVSIGCVVTGLATDKKLGHELWESGCSIVEVFLSENKRERYQLDWVQATVSLLMFNGLFSFDGITDNQLMIFKQLWICNPKLSKINNGITDIDTEYILPCQYCYYVVNCFLVMFTENKAWYLSMNDLDGYILELDSRLTLPQALGVLLKEPLILKEATSSSLLLICAVFELLESDLKLQILNDNTIYGGSSPLFVTKISKILDNIIESIRIFYSRSSSTPVDVRTIKHLDVFWCVWHAIHIRARVPYLFFEKPKGLDKVNLEADQLNSPFKTLSIELKSMKRFVEEKRLNDGEYWQNEYIKVAPSFVWSLQATILRSTTTRLELPIERLIHVRIVFYGILLIQKLEESTNEYERQFLNNLIDELALIGLPSDGFTLLSQRIFQYMKDTLCVEGAWHIGSKLGEVLNEFDGILERSRGV